MWEIRRGEEKMTHIDCRTCQSWEPCHKNALDVGFTAEEMLKQLTPNAFSPRGCDGYVEMMYIMGPHLEAVRVQ